MTFNRIFFYKFQVEFSPLLLILLYLHKNAKNNNFLRIFCIFWSYILLLHLSIFKCFTNSVRMSVTFAPTTIPIITIIVTMAIKIISFCFLFNFFIILNFLLINFQTYLYCQIEPSQLTFDKSQTEIFSFFRFRTVPN